MAETVSLPEASTLTGMSEVQIRRVVKSKKVIASLTNQGYQIDKDSLLALYPAISKNDKQVIIQENTPSVDLTAVIQPLLDRIAYYDNEKERTMHLLESGRAEKEEIKERFIKESEAIREKFVLELRKKDLRITIYKWCSLWLFIVLMISVLISKWFLLIKF